MNESFPFYVYSGLLTKEHRKRIGSALWEFLWCIDKTTLEVPDGDSFVGLVLRGKPINLKEIGSDIGGDNSTISRNLEKLEKNGYLIVVRSPYGLILKVRNSKKWVVAKTQREPKKRKLTVAKMQLPLQKRNAHCKNALSNKDKAVDKAVDKAIDQNIVVVGISDPETNSNPTDNEGVPFPRLGNGATANTETGTDSTRNKISIAEYMKLVKDKYIQRRAKGIDFSNVDLNALDEIIKAKIPLRTVIEGIDKSFDEFKPEHSRDKIHSLNYCVPVVFSLHTIQSRASPQTGFLPESLREEISRPAVEQAASVQTDPEYEKLLAQMISGGSRNE